jgi:3-deoxy-manno-octulosonate cytidylyltransferase (CMP-KDO synthetase)
VATDSKKISNVVLREKYNSLMTSSKCLTGTDRVAEAAKKIVSKIYINVQGDEPTINPRDIKKVINMKIKFPHHVICGYDRVHNFEDPSNINLPKVVVNEKNDLIYISRALIPGKKKQNEQELNKFYNKKKKGTIEKLEDIEILRFLELGIKIKMVKLNSNTVAVDEIKDVYKAEKLLKKKLNVSGKKIFRSKYKK